MFKISYKAEKSMKEILNEVEVPVKKVVLGLKILEGETLDKIRSIIRAGKKRPAGAKDVLEDAMTSEKIGDGKDTIGFGVGNIEKLKVEAPHFLAINFGSSHMVGKKVPLGAFKPGIKEPIGSAGYHSRWYVGEGKRTFIVKRPIKPIDYIERTAFWLANAWDKLISSLGR